MRRNRGSFCITTSFPYVVLEILAGGSMPRGRPPAHSRDQVVDAAIGIADAEGLGAVTMRRIAQQIGAGAMSLYTYVPDKDRLVDLMVDRVGATRTPVEITGDWRTDLLALAGSQRSLMLAHPW